MMWMEDPNTRQDVIKLFGALAVHTPFALKQSLHEILPRLLESLKEDYYTKEVLKLIELCSPALSDHLDVLVAGFMSIFEFPEPKGGKRVRIKVIVCFILQTSTE